jgi:hypothetical protein
MAKRERNPPLLARRRAAQSELSSNTDDGRLRVCTRVTPSGALAAIALRIGIGLKASIGLVSEPYVTSVGYIASREEHNSFSCRDISSCVLSVPIRDDPEMVVNLGLRLAEAGLQRQGAAA